MIKVPTANILETGKMWLKIVQVIFLLGSFE